MMVEIGEKVGEVKLKNGWVVIVDYIDYGLEGGVCTNIRQVHPTLEMDEMIIEIPQNKLTRVIELLQKAHREISSDAASR